MSGSVLDASALLAYLRTEPGADRVIAAIATGASMTSLNFGEVAGWFVRQGADEAYVRSLRARLVFPLVLFDDDLSIRAALLLPATRSVGLSLGERACLALAERSGVPALTADRAWSGVAEAAGVVVTLIR
jgi:ribonuclease VapC